MSFYLFNQNYKNCSICGANLSLFIAKNHQSRDPYPCSIAPGSIHWNDIRYPGKLLSFNLPFKGNILSHNHFSYELQCNLLLENGLLNIEVFSEGKQLPITPSLLSKMKDYLNELNLILLKFCEGCSSYLSSLTFPIYLSDKNQNGNNNKLATAYASSQCVSYENFFSFVSFNDLLEFYLLRVPHFVFEETFPRPNMIRRAFTGTIKKKNLLSCYNAIRGINVQRGIDFTEDIIANETPINILSRLETLFFYA